MPGTLGASQSRAPFHQENDYLVVHKSSAKPFPMEAAVVTGLQHNTGKTN